MLLVGAERIELPTSCSQSRCATAALRPENGCWQHSAPGHSLECVLADERPLLPTSKRAGLDTGFPSQTQGSSQSGSSGRGRSARHHRSLLIAASRPSAPPLRCWPPLLSRGGQAVLERVGGIEPPSPAWKAGALPLSYTRRALTNRIHSSRPSPRDQRRRRTSDSACREAKSSGSA